MNTQESNKLIAQFLEWESRFSYRDFWDIWKTPFGSCSTNKLKFHYSWDWLMPVVEKIKSVKYSNALYEGTWTVMMIDNQCIIAEYPQAYFNDGSSVCDRCAEVICDVSDSSLIIATYKAVVEFIEWYNNQKQNKEI